MGFDTSKVSATDDVVSAPTDLDAMLGEAKTAFIDWAVRSLAEVKPKAGRLSGPDFVRARDEVFAIFHDLKGAGGGVGMELISDIGDSGCLFLRKLEAPSALAAKVAQAHIAAAEGVIAAGIHGDGGAAGEALAEKLRGYAE